MREPSDVRRQRILAVVRSRGAARVSDLAAELEVSVVTVRRDVEELARAGKLRRGHGVARWPVPAEPESAAGAPEPVPGGRGAAAGGRGTGVGASGLSGRGGELAVDGRGPVAGGEVALVVPERHTYLHEVVHGARTALESAGMRAVLHIAPQAAGAERPIVERVLGDVRGLLIAPRWRTVEGEEEDYDWLARLDVPTVLMERRPRQGSVLHAVDSVCSDHWYGVHLAVEHLISLGHRRIVLAARDDSPTARAVRAAFAEIVAARPEIEDSTVVLSSPNARPHPQDGPAEPVRLAELLRERRATAAVMHGDVDALMLVQQLAEAGIRVPRDCSVVAYDDVVAALGSTPLTAVAPPKAEVGRVAAGLLLERLAHQGVWLPRRVQPMPELKVRGSTDRLTV